MLALAQLQERIGEHSWYAQQFGVERDVIAAKKALAQSVLSTFLRSFGNCAHTLVAVCFVPGRVEVLGKHTDYAGGHSLLAAVDRGFFCISARNGTSRVRLAENDPRFPACDFEISPNLEPAVGHWSNYPMTMVRRLASNFSQIWGEDVGESGNRSAGVDVAFGCDLPIAGGLSGSSALMIMTFFALAVPNRLMEAPLFQTNVRDSLDLAMYLACAENGQTFGDLVGGAGVGTFGGSEDHTQILNAKPGMLSWYQFCPTQHKGDLPFPQDIALVIAHSGVRAEKTGAAMEQYNLASRRARLAVAQYNDQFGTRHRLLREILDEQWDSDEAMLAKAHTALNGSGNDPGLDLIGRFVQFYHEDRQVIPQAATALVARDYLNLGRLIDLSHYLSRSHQRNIIPEIDWLQQSARDLGALAASGFGAGFGGSAYAIVPKGAEREFTRNWRQRYEKQFPERTSASQFFPTAVSGRAGEVFVD